MAVEKKWKKKRRGPLPTISKPEKRDETPEERAARTPDPAKPKGDDHLRLPTAKVVTSPIKGEFLSFPLVGYMSVRQKVNTPLVMLIMALVKEVKKPGQPPKLEQKGLLQIEIPYFSETETSVLAALERLGWDGRVWPPRQEVVDFQEDPNRALPTVAHALPESEDVSTADNPKDAGWPQNDDMAQQTTTAILDMFKLKRTFTFPPNDERSEMTVINVTRPHGPFLLPALPEPEEPVGQHLVTALKDILQEGVSLFYR